MLELAYGSTSRQTQVERLIESLAPLNLDGTLYVGYPVFRSAEERVTSDALLTARECGIVLFDLSTSPAPTHGDSEPWEKDVAERQDDYYRALYNKLLANKELTRGRDLAFPIHVITLLPDGVPVPNLGEAAEFATPASLSARLLSYDPLPDDLYHRVNAAVQRTKNIRPLNKRENVARDDSRGAILKRIEAEIANLDAWQKKGAIEYPEGPQRIRGLAGSGKTVVLALKAAYLHATHPEWRIVVTFQTRSLYQQFEDLIRRFSYDTMNDEPDWTKLRVVHSWGSRSENGLYSEIATTHGFEPKDFLSARKTYGGNAFEGVCRELVDAIRGGSGGAARPMYDAVLIDEAQDFPASFFELIYEVTAPPKRVVWAYDELQNLGEYAMAPASQLFGTDSNGHARVELRNLPAQPQQDIVLPVCYRNSPWALTLAHGLGFGVNRTDGLVQMFDEAQLWEDIGYEVKSGQLALGHHVALKRKATCSPGYFDEYLQPNDAVTFSRFNSELEQARWIADEVKLALDQEELQPRDILVVLSDTYTAKSKSAAIMKALYNVGLSSHLAGVTSSRDFLFMDNSIAITQIYRAKGNEAAMVFVVNADFCYEGTELSKKRNTLFTAITRSRAWVRVCGVGAKMDSLITEANLIRGNSYRLEFDYPTQPEINKLRRIHRDLDAAERDRLDKDIAATISLLDQIEQGSLAIETLPSDLRKKLERLPKTPTAS